MKASNRLLGRFGSRPQMLVPTARPSSSPLMQQDSTSRPASGSPRDEAGRDESHSRIARHTVLNLLGQGTPLIAAFFAIPVITRTLGPERFGVLTIGWAVLGYFSLFDLGLGRALTSLVAVAAEDGDDVRTATLVWTSLAAMVPLGLFGAVVTALISPLLVMHVLKISPALRAETLASFYVLAVAIPIVILTSALRGVLEGVRRFDLVNALRVPLGLATFLAPVAVLPFSRSLPVVLIALLSARILALIGHWLLVFHAVPAVKARIAFSMAELKALLRFGSWMTVSNILSPLMVNADRFLIGALISMSAVAYYTAPYEAITKLLMIPAAATAALFPAFSAGFHLDRDGVNHLYQRSLSTALVLLTPIVLVAVLFSHEILGLWLGPDYAQRSAHVLQWLAGGVLVNSIGYVAFALVQAAGRPDITAKLHFLEVPLYGLLLWILVPRFGIVGVAAAWALRCGLDALILCGVARFVLGLRFPDVGRLLLGGGLLAVLVAWAATPMHLSGKFVFSMLAVPACVLVSWYLILSETDRGAIRVRLAGAR